GGLRAGACEVDYGRAPRAIDPDFHADDGAGVHRHLEFAVGEFADHPTDRLLRIVLDMAHIGVDDGKSVYGASPAQPLDALGASRGLRLQIGDVLFRTARGVGAARQHGTNAVFVEASAADHLDAVEQGAFFGDGFREGWHRARRDAADVGVVAARCDVEGAHAIDEHRHDDGDIG